MLLNLNLDKMENDFMEYKSFVLTQVELSEEKFKSVRGSRGK